MIVSTLEKNILENNSSDVVGRKPFFQTNPPFLLSLIRDDHWPFLVRGVPIIHLIPHPFPRTWHRITDNLANLNVDSIRRLATVLQVFLLDSLIRWQHTRSQVDRHVTMNENALVPGTSCTWAVEYKYESLNDKCASLHLDPSFQLYQVQPCWLY